MYLEKDTLKIKPTDCFCGGSHVLLSTGKKVKQMDQVVWQKQKVLLLERIRV